MSKNSDGAERLFCSAALLRFTALRGKMASVKALGSMLGSAVSLCC